MTVWLHAIAEMWVHVVFGTPEPGLRVAALRQDEPSWCNHPRAPEEILTFAPKRRPVNPTIDEVAQVIMDTFEFCRPIEEDLSHVAARKIVTLLRS